MQGVLLVIEILFIMFLFSINYHFIIIVKTSVCWK